MFLGHFAVALAAKRVAPRQSLGTLFLAAQFADLLWPALLLAGVEQVRIDPAARPIPLVFEHYPYSHSLLALTLWGVALGAVAWAVTRDRIGAAVVAALVVSHWLLDALVHRPDLPLAFGHGPLIGLSLWSSNLATLLLELTLFAAGLGLYLRVRPAQRRRVAFWTLIVVLLAIYAGDRFGGSVPPSVAAVAWVTQAMWLFVAWAWWLDRPAPAPVRASS